MALIALIAAAEAMLFSAWAKRGEARRQQVLMGTGMDPIRALLPVDEYLKRKTARASKVQIFVASKVAEICRRAVHTRSFEYLLLHVIRTAVLKRRRKLSISHGRVTL